MCSFCYFLILRWSMNTLFNFYMYQRHWLFLRVTFSSEMSLKFPVIISWIPRERSIYIDQWLSEITGNFFSLPRGCFYSVRFFSSPSLLAWRAIVHERRPMTTTSKHCPLLQRNPQRHTYYPDLLYVMHFSGHFNSFPFVIYLLFSARLNS